MIFLSLSFFLLLLLKNNPLILLNTILVCSFLIILSSYFYTMNIWISIMFFLSFLVGLFLLFMYMISFLTKNINTNTLQSPAMASMTKIFFFLMSYLLLLFLMKNKNSTPFNNNYEVFFNLYAMKMELMNIMFFWFIFLTLLIFSIVKLTKKNMKSSI